MCLLDFPDFALFFRCCVNYLLTLTTTTLPDNAYVLMTPPWRPKGSPGTFLSYMTTSNIEKNQ